MAITPECLPTGISYHFHVIYNAALSVHSETDDTELSRDFVEYLVHKLESAGLRGFYHDRDSRSGRNIFNELDKLFESSKWTIVVLTRGFVRDCWTRYLKIAAFHKVLHRKNHDRVYVVAVGLNKNNIPTQLVNKRVVLFDKDWEPELSEWGKFIHSFRRYISPEDFTRLTLPLEYQTSGRRPQRLKTQESEKSDLPIYPKTKSRSPARDTYLFGRNEIYSLPGEDLFEKQTSRKKRGKQKCPDSLLLGESDDKYYELPDKRCAREHSRLSTSLYERSSNFEDDYDYDDYERKIAKYYPREYDDSLPDLTADKSKYMYADRSATKDLYEIQNSRIKDYANMSFTQKSPKDGDFALSLRKRYKKYSNAIETRETQTPDIPELGRKQLFYIDIPDCSNSSNVTSVDSPRQLVYTNVDSELVGTNYISSAIRDDDHLSQVKESMMYDSEMGVDTAELLKTTDEINDHDLEISSTTNLTHCTQHVATEEQFIDTHPTSWNESVCPQRASSLFHSKRREESPQVETKKHVLHAAMSVTDKASGTHDYSKVRKSDSSTDTRDLLQSVDSSIQASNIMFNQYCNGESDIYGWKRVSDVKYSPVRIHELEQKTTIGYVSSRSTKFLQSPRIDTQPDNTKNEICKTTDVKDAIRPISSAKSNLLPPTSRSPQTIDESNDRDNDIVDGRKQNVFTQNLEAYDRTTPRDAKYQPNKTEGEFMYVPILRMRISDDLSNKLKQRNEPFSVDNEYTHHLSDGYRDHIGIGHYSQIRSREDVGNDFENFLRSENSSDITESMNQEFTRYISTDSGVQSTVSADSTSDTFCFSHNAKQVDSEQDLELASSASTVTGHDLSDENMVDLPRVHRNQYDVPITLLQTVDSGFINNAPLCSDINNFQPHDTSVNDKRIVETLFENQQTKTATPISSSTLTDFNLSSETLNLDGNECNVTSATKDIPIPTYELYNDSYEDEGCLNQSNVRSDNAVTFPSKDSFIRSTETYMSLSSSGEKEIGEPDTSPHNQLNAKGHIEYGIGFEGIASETYNGVPARFDNTTVQNKPCISQDLVNKLDYLQVDTSPPPIGFENIEDDMNDEVPKRLDDSTTCSKETQLDRFSPASSVNECIPLLPKIQQESSIIIAEETTSVESSPFLKRDENLDLSISTDEIDSRVALLVAQTFEEDADQVSLDPYHTHDSQYRNVCSDHLQYSMFDTSVPVKVSLPPINTVMPGIDVSSSFSSVETSSDTDDKISPKPQTTFYRQQVNPEFGQITQIEHTGGLTMTSAPENSSLQSVKTTEISTLQNNIPDESIIKSYVKSLVQSSVDEYYSKNICDESLGQDSSLNYCDQTKENTPTSLVYRTPEYTVTDDTNNDGDSFVAVRLSPGKIDWSKLFRGDDALSDVHKEGVDERTETSDQKCRLNNIVKRLLTLAEIEKDKARKKSDRSNDALSGDQQSVVCEEYRPERARRPCINWDLVYKECMVSNVVKLFKDAGKKHNKHLDDMPGNVDIDSTGDKTETVGERTVETHVEGIQGVLDDVDDSPKLFDSEIKHHNVFQRYKGDLSQEQSCDDSEIDTIEDNIEATMQKGAENNFLRGTFDTSCETAAKFPLLNTHSQRTGNSKQHDELEFVTFSDHYKPATVNDITSRDVVLENISIQSEYRDADSDLEKETEVPPDVKYLEKDSTPTLDNKRGHSDTENKVHENCNATTVTDDIHEDNTEQTDVADLQSDFPVQMGSKSLTRSRSFQLEPKNNENGDLVKIAANQSSIPPDIISFLSSDIDSQLSISVNTLGGEDCIKASVTKPSLEWEKVMKLQNAGTIETEVRVKTNVRTTETEAPLQHSPNTDNKLELKEMVNRLMGVVHEAEKIKKGKKMSHDVNDSVGGCLVTEVIEKCSETHVEKNPVPWDVLESFVKKSNEDTDIIFEIKDADSNGTFDAETNSVAMALELQCSVPHSAQIDVPHDSEPISAAMVPELQSLTLSSVPVDVPHVDNQSTTNEPPISKHISVVMMSELQSSAPSSAQVSESINVTMENELQCSAPTPYLARVDASYGENRAPSNTSDSENIDYIQPKTVEKKQLDWHTFLKFSDYDVTTTIRENRVQQTERVDRQVQLKEVVAQLIDISRASRKKALLSKDDTYSPSETLSDVVDWCTPIRLERSPLTFDTFGAMGANERFREACILDDTEQSPSESNADQSTEEVSFKDISHMRETDNEIRLIPDEDPALFEIYSPAPKCDVNRHSHDSDSVDRIHSIQLNDIPMTVDTGDEMYESVTLEGQVQDMTHEEFSKTENPVGLNEQLTTQVVHLNIEHDQLEFEMEENEIENQTTQVYTLNENNPNIAHLTYDTPDYENARGLVETDHATSESYVKDVRTYTNSDEGGNVELKDRTLYGLNTKCVREDVSEEEMIAQTYVDEKQKSPSRLERSVLQQMDDYLPTLNLTHIVESECLPKSPVIHSPTKIAPPTQTKVYSNSESRRSIDGSDSNGSETDSWVIISSESDSIESDDEINASTETVVSVDLSNQTTGVEVDNSVFETKDTNCEYSSPGSSVDPPMNTTVDREQGACKENTKSVVSHEPSKTADKSDEIRFIEEEIMSSSVMGAECAVRQDHLLSEPLTADHGDEIITIEVYGSNSPVRELKSDFKNTNGKPAAASTMYTCGDGVPDLDELRDMPEIPGGRRLYSSERHRSADALQDMTDFRLGERTGASRQRHSSTMSAQPEQTGLEGD